MTARTDGARYTVARAAAGRPEGACPIVPRSTSWSVRPARRRRAPPLVVLLHGIGADERDLLPLADALDPRLAVASLRAPHEAEPMGYAWYALDWRTSPPTPRLDEAERSRAALAAFLPELAARTGAAPARTFLLGFSQGAVMALAVALTRPDLVRGVVAHSARLLPFLERPEGRAPPEALARLEALVLHGADDDVIPVENGRAIRDVLAPLLGERVTYAEHDAGHFVTEASLADVAAWLAVRIAP